MGSVTHIATYRATALRLRQLGHTSQEAYDIMMLDPRSKQDGLCLEDVRYLYRDFTRKEKEHETRNQCSG